MNCKEVQTVESENQSIHNHRVKTPWLISKDPEVPEHIDYYAGTMYEALCETARKYPDNIAFDFMGKKTTYRDFLASVRECAKAFKGIGIRVGDRVMICMPNCPQALMMFYAVNAVGAIASMIHPLSAESEIAFYIRDSGCIAAVTLDQFYSKFKNVRKAVSLPTLIITSVADEMKLLMKIGYAVTEQWKIPVIGAGEPVLTWRVFLHRGDHVELFKENRNADDPAVILYSGGTTGKTKGIVLTNMNFNALAMQIVATNPFFRPGDKMLAIMPMFHGFGLGVSIHSMIFNGGRCILVPRFTPKSYVQLLKKHRPNLIAGVPTLFEALMRVPEAEKLDLSCLKGMFSGGDSLSVELKKRLDLFLKEHGAKIEVREGYGTTECVTASCLTPIHKSKEGSIGLPFPDMYYKIVKPGTMDEVPYGEEGEICLAGPTVMLEYMDNPEETAATLKKHADGLTWVHTGDLGSMDEEGFVYYRQRIKRMIITNGYNVYPSQIENILDGHEYVHMSCVIGVPDERKKEKVKAFVVLKPGYIPTEGCKEELMTFCKKHIAKYALPYDIEFRNDLPKTLVGKVAYRILEEEEAAKREQEAQEALLREELKIRHEPEEDSKAEAQKQQKEVKAEVQKAERAARAESRRKKHSALRTGKVREDKKSKREH